MKSINQDPNILRVPLILGVLVCYPYHIDKPYTTYKLASKILTSVATRHEQTIKYASFCTQNEQKTWYYRLYTTIPTDMRMVSPV